MFSKFSILAFLSISTLIAAAPLQSRATACFVIGSTVLPQEVIDTVTSIQCAVTCNLSATTISGVPDPLAFALEKFATASVLADTDLAAFQDMLNVYEATEAGIRSVAGNLAIKAPKFFILN